MYRIIIADDHKMVAEAISRLVETIEVEGSRIGEVVSIAYTLEETRKACEELKPDILLVDMAMPDGNGIDFIPKLQELCPTMKIAVLTYYSEASIVRLALNNGARGYFLKACNAQELVQGLKKVGEGEVYVCEEAMMTLRKKNKAETLTNREKEILRLIVEGFSTKEIAVKLYLSFETVHSYMKNIRQKLGVSNTASIVREAIRQQLI
ncbi:MAG: response regulator transcription factor [Bacteroidaceae bacterium]|nr:response regulator transcription factor [Bacteroidaceae bacterium]